MPKRKKECKPDELPEYARQWRLEREKSLDFEELRREFKNLRMYTQIIAIPAPEIEQEMLVSRSVSVNLKWEEEYWYLHEFPVSNGYRARVKEFNASLVASGLTSLESGEPVEIESWTGIVLRALEREQLSTAFLDAWAQLNTLSGRYIELMSLQEGAKKPFEDNLRKGAKSATLGQHVWYARWLVKHVVNFDLDRQKIDDEFIELCVELKDGSRASPDAARWSPEWFGKLLHKRKGRGLITTAENSPALIERLDRMSERQLRKLAFRKISSSLLPPLALECFARVSNHP